MASVTPEDGNWEGPWTMCTADTRPGQVLPDPPGEVRQRVPVHVPQRGLQYRAGRAEAVVVYGGHSLAEYAVLREGTTEGRAARSEFAARMTPLRVSVVPHCI